MRGSEFGPKSELLPGQPCTLERKTYRRFRLRALARMQVVQNDQYHDASHLNRQNRPICSWLVLSPPHYPQRFTREQLERDYSDQEK
jgi:hypothetical protein